MGIEPLPGDDLGRVDTLAGVLAGTRAHVPGGVRFAVAGSDDGGLGLGALSTCGCDQQSRGERRTQSKGKDATQHWSLRRVKGSTLRRFAHFARFPSRALWARPDNSSL